MLFLKWSFGHVAVQIQQTLINALIHGKNLENILLQVKDKCITANLIKYFFLDLVLKSRPMMPSTGRNMLLQFLQCSVNITVSSYTGYRLL